MANSPSPSSTSTARSATELGFRVEVTTGAADELEAFVDGVRVRLDITESGATGTFTVDGTTRRTASGGHPTDH